MRLVASFPKLDGRDRVATFATYTWADGLVATTRMHGRWNALPHDVEHYVMESQVRPPYGFWAQVERQAPLEGFTVVRGRWPKGRKDWLERAYRKHRDEMVQAEAVGISRIASGELDVHRDWATIRRWLSRGYAISAPSVYASLTQADLLHIVDVWREVHAAWDAVPVGESLEIHWPPRDAPRIG